MPSPAKLSRETKMKEKAMAFFVMYKMMGPDRSLSRLLKLCTMAGLKTSEQSLKRYSTDYGWQRKLIEQQATDNEKNEQDISNIVLNMNERQARIGQALQTMAEIGLQQKAEAIRKKELIAFDFKDITTLYRAGQTGERLARGLATSREEIKVEIMNVIVQEFALIFLSINDITDPEVRKQEYIRRFNEQLKIQFPQNKSDRQIGQG